MRVGILGSSDVAKSLGRGFLNEGHEVMLGSREPGKLASWARDSGQGRRVLRTSPFRRKFRSTLPRPTLPLKLATPAIWIASTNFRPWRPAGHVSVR